MELMEENRDDDVGSTRGGSIHPDVENMDHLLPPIRDYGHPSAVTPLVIRRLTIQANNFELKSITLQLLQGIPFYGLAHEDSNAHILNFLEVCDTVKYNGVSDDAIWLRLFPFSLKDKAKQWLILEPPDSITSWNDLSNKFLARFFPSANDSCHSRVIQNQQNLYPKFPPIAIVKLLQYSGSRVEHRDGFSSYK